MSIASKISAAAFGLSTLGAVGTTLLGRRSDQFGLLDMSMPALAATLTTCTRPGRVRNAATIALLASTAGDMSGTLELKVGWFAAAHVAYIAAFWPARPAVRPADSTLGKCAPDGYKAGRTARRPWFLVGPAIILAGAWASANAGDLRLVYVAYATLVAIMALFASSYSRLAGISALVFAASDLLIGYGAWRAQTVPAWAEALTIGLYLAAQAGLTAAVIRGER